MVMPPLLNILLNTPWWVFVLFVVLLVFGVRAFRPRSISVWRSLVIPGVFIAWGAVSLIQQMTQSSSYLLADWLVGGVIGAALLWLTGRPMAMRIERAGIVTVAGSPLPLVRNMLIFLPSTALRSPLHAIPRNERILRSGTLRYRARALAISSRGLPSLSSPIGARPGASYSLREISNSTRPYRKNRCSQLNFEMNCHIAAAASNRRRERC